MSNWRIFEQDLVLERRDLGNRYGSVCATRWDEISARRESVGLQLSLTEAISSENRNNLSEVEMKADADETKAGAWPVLNVFPAHDKPDTARAALAERHHVGFRAKGRRAGTHGVPLSDEGG